MVVICPLTLSPSVAEGALQAVTQLALQRRVREMPCRLHLRGAGIGVWLLGWDLRLLPACPQ